MLEPLDGETHVIESDPAVERVAAAEPAADTLGTIQVPEVEAFVFRGLTPHRSFILGYQLAVVAEHCRSESGFVLKLHADISSPVERLLIASGHLHFTWQWSRDEEHRYVGLLEVEPVKPAKNQ